MGIYNFNNWIKTEYSNCFKSNQTKSGTFFIDIYDHIYIDLNFILHNVVFSASNQKIFLTSLFEKIDHVLDSHLATKSVTIAIDGPGPIAKIDLQKKRREGKEYNENSNISSLVLTPGTQFMESLEHHVKDYIESRKRRYKFRKIVFNFLPASQPDEGEIKLLKKIHENNNKDPSSTHLIVGNDADLVVMATALGDVDNIYILLRDIRSYKLFDLDSFLLEHSKQYMGIKDNLDYYQNFYYLRSDFAVLSIMMGNDYIPRVSYAKFDKIWETYRQTRKELPDSFLMIDNRFNTVFFERFFSNYKNKISKNFMKNPKYKKSEIKNYLEGVLWCLDMYRKGVCRKYDFKIINNNKPHPVDLHHYCNNNNIFEMIPPSSDFKPLNPQVCGVVLLPKRALNLMSDKVKTIAISNLSRFYEREDCKECSKTKKTISGYQKTIFNLRKNLREDPKNPEKIEKDIKNIQDKLIDMNSFYKDHVEKHNKMSIEEVCSIMNKNLI